MRKRKFRSVYMLLTSMLFVSACTLGSDFIRPESSVQSLEMYVNNPAQKNDEKSISRWWERIEDPLLNQYVEQLLSQNLTLMQAAERITQARTQIKSENAAYLPSVSGAGNGARSFSPGTTKRIYSNSYSAELSSAWEIDLFGKIRRSVEAVDASYLASVYDREALVHSLIADLVALRVEIAVDQKLLALAKRNAKNRKEIYLYVKNQYELGIEGSAPQNVLQAEDNYTSVQSDIHMYERLLADAMYRLDVLLGQVPGTTNPVEDTFPMIVPPMDMPVCLPADLLDRRPDLRASELRVKAANAEIGVAIADLYPSLNLGASLGVSGATTNGLFTASQLAGSILGNITARIFEGGALRANIALQESQARELAAAYAEDVLNALYEVETNLKSESVLIKELINDQKSVEALLQAEGLIEERYKRGLESFSDYLDAQRQLYSAEQTLLNTRQAYWNARLSLYLALGGDWFSDESDVGCAVNGDAGAFDDDLPEYFFDEWMMVDDEYGAGQDE